MLKNKKATVMFLEFVLKLLVAAVCIGFLVYIGSLTFDAFRAKQLRERASSNLDNILGRINYISGNEKEGYSEKVLFLGPKEWYLIYYDADFPKTCVNKNCLCLCPYASAELCDKEGACKNLGENINIGVENLENVGHIFYPNLFYFEEIPENLFLKKVGQKVILSKNELKVEPKERLDLRLNGILNGNAEFNGQTTTVKSLIVRYASNGFSNPENEKIKEAVCGLFESKFKDEKNKAVLAIHYTTEKAGVENYGVFVDGEQRNFDGFASLFECAHEGKTSGDDGSFFAGYEIYQDVAGFQEYMGTAIVRIRMWQE